MFDRFRFSITQFAVLLQFEHPTLEVGQQYFYCNVIVMWFVYITHFLFRTNRLPCLCPYRFLVNMDVGSNQKCFHSQHRRWDDVAVFRRHLHSHFQMPCILLSSVYCAQHVLWVMAWLTHSHKNTLTWDQAHTNTQTHSHQRHFSKDDMEMWVLLNELIIITAWYMCIIISIQSVSKLLCREFIRQDVSVCVRMQTSAIA